MSLNMSYSIDYTNYISNLDKKKNPLLSEMIFQKYLKVQFQSHNVNNSTSNREQSELYDNKEKILMKFKRRK